MMYRPKTTIPGRQFDKMFHDIIGSHCCYLAINDPKAGVFTFPFFR